ncbi:hypothetical protein R3P38DRAFT_1318294 [Favolaschia claudopus]|uniref:Uncharacterized protein n=1 Tax=Favolaschia claudopus TaxID=2862362 RepID=A0AAW0AX65_9AGAR
MTLPLTFASKKLLETSLIGPDNMVHYTTSTTKSSCSGRKLSTVTAASGVVGVINWRDKTFSLNGVVRKWDEIKRKSAGAGMCHSDREWNWGPRPFNLKYHGNCSSKELLATPLNGTPADTVRFTTHRQHLLHDNERAVLYFPYHMQDELERMFLLLVVLYMDVKRQDQEKEIAGAAIDASTATI